MPIGGFISDLLGPAVSTYLTPALEGAATGALGSVLQGKNPLTGGLVGGVTGAGIGAFGGADGALAQALGLTGPQVNALIGGAGGALGYGLTGQNPLIGGGLGALGGYLYGGSGQGQDPYTQGGDQKEGGAGSGWTDASSGKPVDSTGNTYGDTAGAATAGGKGGGPLGALASGILGGGDGSSGISKTQLLLAALAALGSATSKPKQGDWATPGPASNAANLGPTFNAPLNTNVRGRGAVNPFASPTPQYWTYGGPEQTYFTGNSLKSYGFADGGALSAGVEGVYEDGGAEFSTSSGQHYVQGPGDGKEDLIPAMLADGEYVLDATTVSRIGNGSNRRGAEKIDAWRRGVAKAAGSDTVVQKTVNPGALMQALGGAV